MQLRSMLIGGRTAFTAGREIVPVLPMVGEKRVARFASFSGRSR